MTLVNVPLHIAYQKQFFVRKPIQLVILSSSQLWPLQLWTYSWKKTTKEPLTELQIQEEAKKTTQELERVLGKLPREVRGVVEFDYHIATEVGREAVWLKEFGDFYFFSNSETFDRLGIETGKSFSFYVEEKSGLEVGINGPVAWITDGQENDI